MTQPAPYQFSKSVRLPPGERTISIVAMKLPWRGRERKGLPVWTFQNSICWAGD